jgi:hypothetical protein
MSSSHSFCKCIFIVTILSEKRIYKDENTGFETKWEEEFVFLERNQIKYSFENQNITKDILRELHQ